MSASVRMDFRVTAIKIAHSIHAQEMIVTSSQNASQIKKKNIYVLALKAIGETEKTVLNMIHVQNVTKMPSVMKIKFANAMKILSVMDFFVETQSNALTNVRMKQSV